MKGALLINLGSPDSTETKDVKRYLGEFLMDERVIDIAYWKRFLLIYKKHQVDFKWIKGHNNHPQNERCDELAVMASTQQQLSVDKFYEKEDEKLL